MKIDIKKIYVIKEKFSREKEINVGLLICDATVKATAGDRDNNIIIEFTLKGKLEKKEVFIIDGEYSVEYEGEFEEVEPVEKIRVIFGRFYSEYLCKKIKNILKEGNLQNLKIPTFED
ncbi:MAG: hypothetical protein ACRC51_07995 [Cetobacterium sp.]